MEKAKNKIREYVGEYTDIERSEGHMDGLKPAINNLLHMYLPGNITVEQSEALALVIYDIIWNPYSYISEPSIKIS